MIEARAQGMEAIEPASALNAWGNCDRLLTSTAYAAIFALSNFQPGTTTLPIFSELFNDISQDKLLADNNNFDIPAENRSTWLITDIRKLVATELKLPMENVEPKRPLIDMGVNSLMTVSLRVRLRQRYGFEFPPTLLWNNPSVYAISHFINNHLSQAE